MWWSVLGELGAFLAGLAAVLTVVRHEKKIFAPIFHVRFTPPLTSLGSIFQYDRVTNCRLPGVPKR